MSFQFNVFSVTLLLSGLATVGISLVLFRRLGTTVHWFGLMMLAIAVWALGYGFELASTTKENMLFWVDLQYLGIALLPATWLVFVVKFIGKEQWLNMHKLSLLFLMPILTLLLVWTNEWHHIHYTQLSLDTTGPFPLLAIQPGPWYRIHTVYFYVMLAWGSYLMLSTFGKADAVYRKQNVTILISTLIPWVANIIYLLGFRPLGHIDLTPYAFIVTAIVFSVGMFRLKWFDIVPVARGKVIDAMREGVLVLDKQGRIVDFNAQLKNHLAPYAHPAIGMDILDLLPIANKLVQLVNERVNATILVELEEQEVLRFLEVDSTILYEKGTIYSGQLLLFRDVTERKLADRRASSATNLLTGVLDSSLSGVMAFRSLRNEQQEIIDFECIGTNRRAIDLTPWKVDEIVGNRLLNLAFLPREAKLFKAYIEVVHTGQPLEVERKFLVNGTSYWLHIAAVKLEDGLTITFTDISERKKNEAQILHNEASLLALIENTTDAIWSIDRQYRLVTINSVFIKETLLYSGQRPKVGDYLNFENYPADLMKEWMALYNRGWEGKPFTTEVPITRDNHVYVYEYSFNPIRNGKGEIDGLTIFGRNITERKEAEREVQLAKEAAENASLFKTRFLANMSHEIRTPINAIMGFTEVLRKQPLSRQQQEYLAYIHSASDSLLKLIGEILDITKIEEGKMTVSKESFCLTEVMTTTLQPYGSQAKEKGLTFHLQFDPAIPTFLIGDAGKLSQVLINLIGNALKFTREGGIGVDFSVEQPGLVMESETIYLKVAVTDTGIGVPVEQQERIFQSFTQADGSISRKFGGSGLGLTIVKEMIQLMSGEVGLISPAFELGSDKGFGSTFWFTLPLRIDSQRVVATPPGTLDPSLVTYQSGARVLVVEDNPVNQRLAKLILEEIGCQVTIASNGSEGVVQARQNAFDIILMDVQMPVMDGYTATSLIREFNTQVPIIGLSANAYQEDVDKGVQAGMNDYLSKPYSAEKLLDKLRKWVGVVVAPFRPLTEDPKPVSTLVNLQFLYDLMEGNLHDIESILSEVLLVQNEFITALNQWFEKEEGANLAAAAHKLKGSVHLVGADLLRQPLDEVEKRFKAGDCTDEMVALCLATKHACEQLEADLKNEMAHLLEQK